MKKKFSRKYISLFLITILLGIIVYNVVNYFFYKGTEKKINVLINDESFYLQSNDSNKIINLDMIDTSKGIKIKNLSKSDLYVNNRIVNPKKEYNVKLTKLDRDDTISLKLKFADDNNFSEYIINTIPDSFPDFETYGKSNYDGDYYIAVNSYYRHYILKINNNGDLIFYKNIGLNVYSFNKYIFNGKARYSYIVDNDVIGNPTPMHYVVLDEDYNEIDDVIYYLGDDKYIDIDYHDTVYLGDGHYILASFQDKDINNMPLELGYGSNITVQTCLIEEVKDGEILWQFDSSNYPELYKYFNSVGVYDIMPTGEYFANYMHFNSFDIDPKDGNLIVSFRNIGAVIKINRSDGKIMWILGGKGDQFGLSDDQKFLCQHSAKYVNDDTIILYDNGADDRKSKIVKLKIDEKDMKIKDYVSYDLGEVYTNSWGYVQAVDLDNDVYLLNYGIGDYSENSTIEEKNLVTGELYFSIQFIESNTFLVYKVS